MTVALILAGGFGTRLRSVMSDYPKPMAPVNGRPFLEYLMDYWIGQGVSSFILSVGYMKQVIIDYFGYCYQGKSLSYAVEEFPLGTGGGLLWAARELEETFLVCNGDTFFAVNLADLMSFHVEKESGWTMALVSTHESDRYMDVDVQADGRIRSLRSRVNRSEGLSNGGVYLVDPSVFQQLDAEPGQNMSLENEILPHLLAVGSRLYGLQFDNKFIDIGVPEEYLRVAQFLHNV